MHSLRANFSWHKSTIVFMDGSLSTIYLIELSQRLMALKCPVRELLSACAIFLFLGSRGIKMLKAKVNGFILK